MPEPFPPLSPQTHACVQNLARAKHETETWRHHLEQALADDVAANPPRLTPEQAAVVAKAHDVKAPPAPGEQPEAQETTAESNQAQLDAQTKLAEAEAAKTAPPPPQPPKAEPDDDKKPAPKTKADDDDEDDKKPAAKPAQNQTQTRR